MLSRRRPCHRCDHRRIRDTVATRGGSQIPVRPPCNDPGVQDETPPPADAPAATPEHQIARSTGQIYRQVRDAVTALAQEVDQVKRGAGFTAALDAMSQF